MRNRNRATDKTTGRFVKVPPEERFIVNVAKHPNGCWIWKLSLDKDGYGRSTVSGKGVWAHRVSWMLHHGNIPEGMQVLHKCDNRPCVNPDHLFLGTNRDNMHDKVRKDRHTKGEAVNTNKLSEYDVIYIRKAINGGANWRSLADKFKVSQTTIYDIKNGRSWNWLEERELLAS